jgi:hypothetical protein
MENITYELILKYLTKKKNIFLTEPYQLNYNFLDKYTTILTDTYYRYGVILYDNNKNNISFWCSILILLKEDYIMNLNNYSIITEYKNFLIDSHNKKISNFLKKYEKNDFREYFKLNPDIIIIQYIVDILNINIFIFDFLENNIYAVYKNNSLDPYIDTILIANYNNFWEPIMTNNKKIFNYNDQIIKDILKEDIKYYSFQNIDKIFSYNVNDKQKDTKNITINKLDKLKKEELVKILELNNINYPKKNTNKQLIELIKSSNLIK